jgi:hypothetical protein
MLANDDSFEIKPGAAGNVGAQCGPTTGAGVSAMTAASAALTRVLMLLASLVSSPASGIGTATS